MFTAVTSHLHSDDYGISLFTTLSLWSVSPPSPSPQVLRKALASAITLGSGASLGPEAPSVEIGANTASILAPKTLNKRRQRMLIAAGAAAGEGGWRPVVFEL